MKKLIKATSVAVGTIYGIIRAIVDIWALSGTTNIPNRVLFIAALVFSAALFIAGYAILNYKRVLKNGTVYRIISYSLTSGRNLYYTPYSKNLRYGIIVTVYYKKPISKKVGFGVVRNISVDEYVEIEMIHILPDMMNIFEQSKTNNNHVLRDMYILPNTYAETLTEIVPLLKKGD